MAEPEFFVRDRLGNLVPPRFMRGLDGAPIVNPNATPNPAPVSNRYFTASGVELQNSMLRGNVMSKLIFDFIRTATFSFGLGQPAPAHPWGRATP